MKDLGRAGAPHATPRCSAQHDVVRLLGSCRLVPLFHNRTLDELRTSRHPAVELDHHGTARRTVEGVVPRVGGEELPRRSRTGRDGLSWIQ